MYLLYDEEDGGDYYYIYFFYFMYMSILPACTYAYALYELFLILVEIRQECQMF